MDKELVVLFNAQRQMAIDELRKELREIIWYELAIWYESGDGLDVTDVDELAVTLLNLIRTEKLKLLAEIRERVVGEDKYPAKESSDLMKQLSPNARRCEWQNELRGEQRTLLDKLEAEL